jgi:hypothetical protein
LLLLLLLSSSALLLSSCSLSSLLFSLFSSWQHSVFVVVFVTVVVFVVVKVVVVGVVVVVGGGPDFDTARLKWAPAATAVAVVPGGNNVDTGTLLFVLVPFPNSPLPFSPQANTFPADVNAKLWSSPPETAVTVVPGGNNVDTGTLLLVLVPFPNWPVPFSPQPNTFPSEVTAKLKFKAPATTVTVVLGGNDENTGILLFVLDAFPNSPLPFSPQANTFPADVNAKL